MSTLNVRLLGRIEIQSGGRKLADLKARKAQELFCYLLCNRDRPHPRETLASLLWGDTATSRSKGYLRKALWQLQSSLESAEEAVGQPVVVVEPDWIQLNPRADLWLDIAIFEHAFKTAQGVPGQELDTAHVHGLRSAVALYRGELLEGWYEEWCLYERVRLQHMYLAMLDKLMKHSEANQEYEMGVMYGLRTLRYEPARESTHRRLMRLHYLAGRRTSALQQYKQCVAALDTELGVPPARQTVELYEQIRDGLLDATPPAVRPRTSAVGPSAGLDQALDHLVHLRIVLSEALNQVQHIIETLDNDLHPRR
jgi:DNA-binding SARP family transcriptional activator